MDFSIRRPLAGLIFEGSHMDECTCSCVMSDGVAVVEVIWGDASYCYELFPCDCGDLASFEILPDTDDETVLESEFSALDDTVME